MEFHTSYETLLAPRPPPTLCTHKQWVFQLPSNDQPTDRPAQQNQQETHEFQGYIQYAYINIYTQYTYKIIYYILLCNMFMYALKQGGLGKKVEQKMSNHMVRAFEGTAKRTKMSSQSGFGLE